MPLSQSSRSSALSSSTAAIDTEYEILINKEGKRVSINNNPLKKVSEYLSKINAIMFCPDDLEIIKGSPQLRRSFFNISIIRRVSFYKRGKSFFGILKD